jgi:hypothetical protein
MACRNYLVVQASGLSFAASRRKPSAMKTGSMIPSPPRAGFLRKLGVTPSLNRTTRGLSG